MKYKYQRLISSKFIGSYLVLIFLSANPFSLTAQNLTSVKGLQNITGNSADEGRSIAVDTAGNIYVTGFFSGSVDFDPGPGVAALVSAGNQDIFIAKYNALGEYVYARAMGGVNKDICNSIAVDKSGNVFITGYFSGTVDFDPGDGVANVTSVENSIDIFIARYDSLGNYVYAKAFGGPGADQGNSLAIDRDGNVYITGSFVDTANFNSSASPVNLSSNSGYADIFFAKYNGAGNCIYAKSLGGPGIDGGSGIAVDSVGNTFITGDFRNVVDFDPGPGIVNVTSGGYDDVFVARYDASGNYVYAKAVGLYPSQSSNLSSGYSIALDKSNNAYVTGYFGYSPGTVPNYNNFLTRLDASGNIKVNRIFVSGSPTSQGPAITVDNFGNCYVTGSFNRALTETAPPLITPSAHNVFVIRYDSSGKAVFAKGFPGSEESFGCGIVTDKLGNIYITGSFNGTVDFNTGSSNNNNVLTTNNPDIFIAKISQATTLPVKLESFTAKVLSNDNTVMLNWRASLQINNAYFEVERSKDGQQFESVGKIEGCSLCEVIENFELKDNNPFTGVSYYRLKEVDKDGKIVYSQIVSIKLLKETLKISLANSISNGEYEIFIENDEPGKELLLQLWNSNGNLIRQQTRSLAAGNTKIKYSLSNVAAGGYFIRVSDKQARVLATIKLIKH